MELVSIVVPVYNAAPYIAKTIEMVQRQTYTEWELLLVDDRSTDGSQQIIRECMQNDKRVRLIEKEKNEGPALARNCGIDQARGRYLAFLDADDVWMYDKLQKELSFMQQKEAAFVFTSYEFGDEEAVGTGKIVHVPETISYRQALHKTVIFTTTTLFDLEKLDKKLVHMPNVASEDSATWWQILKSGVVAYGLDENLAIYRRPARSLSSNKGKAVVRIWNLYRRQEHLPVPVAAWHFVQWALLATIRRL